MIKIISTKLQKTIEICKEKTNIQYNKIVELNSKFLYKTINSAATSYIVTALFLTLKFI